MNVCSLDLSNAFDKMLHYALYMKLLNSTIPLTCLKLLKTGFIHHIHVLDGETTHRILLSSLQMRGREVNVNINVNVHIYNALGFREEQKRGCISGHSGQRR